MISNLFTIPNELFDEIASKLDARSTLNLQLTCRTLSSQLVRAMLLHAVAPKDNIPALHWAATKGHLPLVQYLLSVFPVDLPDDSSDTALHRAAQSCHALVTELLLLHGADVNRINHNGAPPLVCASGGLGRSPAAVEATVQILLAHGANIEGNASAIALSYAINICSPTMARLLLDAGASPDTQSELGVPVIVLASSVAAAVVVLDVLLDYGADISATSPNSVTALMTAAELGFLDTVKILVDRGANLNLVDSFGYSVFAYAAMSNQPHVVAYLVGCHGFDINAEGLVYLTVLYECHEALKVLLQRGASPNLVDCLGQSILHGAVRCTSETAVRSLLENGADIVRDDMDVTPLMVAIDLDNLPVVRILLEYWTVRADGGPGVFQTLMLACRRGSKAIVGLLLEKGVDINMVDGDGLTVMAHAKSAGWDTVVQMIASYGGE